MSAMHLARIDRARNMCRFYRLEVQPDLFGGFAVVKEWGRIGACGRMMDEWHMTEALALAVLQRQAERKRRRISVRVSDAELGGAEIAAPSK
jgi:predicted DNA-binding WGR domain protein